VRDLSNDDIDPLTGLEVDPDVAAALELKVAT